MTLAKFPFAFTILGCALVPASAAISIYTSEAAFLQAAGETGVDSYAGLTTDSRTSSPLSRTAGSFSYVASSSHTSTFYIVGTTGTPALSTNYGYETVTFHDFSIEVVGFGGNFYGTDLSSAFLLGDIRLIVTDKDGPVTHLITGATTTGFLGVLSTNPLVSVAMTANQPGYDVWPTADNVVLAAAKPDVAPPTVPEPATFGAIAAALTLGATVIIRRRARWTQADCVS